MTRNGKIARLPRPIRDELNRRLQNGEPGVRLVEWLNGLPDTQRVLAADFGGRPINEQNLSEWKAGGYRDWQARQEALSQARELTADARELTAATDGRLTDHLATVLAARYAAALAGWDGEVTDEFRRKLRVLRGLCQDIVELRRGDHSGARLNLEQERLEREQEKTEEEVVEHFKRWAQNPTVRDWICQDWVSPEERERRLREVFGLEPKKPDELETGGPESNPVNGPESAPIEPAQAESGQIKPNQTENMNTPQPGWYLIPLPPWNCAMWVGRAVLCPPKVGTALRCVRRRTRSARPCGRGCHPPPQARMPYAAI